MAYELKEGRGSLWKNDKREKEESPHARGQAKIGGVIYWVSAWTEITKDGQKYQSLSFKPKEDQPSSVRVFESPLPQDIDDEIPF